MSSSKIIILILSLYGVASTITYITYIVKYSNLKNKYNLIKSDSNNYLRNNDYNNNSNNNLNLINNCSNITIPNLNYSTSNINISNIISKYDIYYDADFYNKFDLIDEYNDKIIYYSKDLNSCYNECENNDKCYGFSKYHNYCYLKGKFDLSQKNNASKITLVLNSFKE